jgi:hypothetical protein
MIETLPGQFIPHPGPRLEGTVTKPNDPVFMVENVGKYFTLSLADGRKLDFFFLDQKGSIANSGPGLYSDPT